MDIRKFVDANDTYEQTLAAEATPWIADRNFVLDFLNDHIQKQASYGLYYLRVESENTYLKANCHNLVGKVFESLLTDLYCAGYEAMVGIEPNTHKEIIYITWGKDAEARLIEHMHTYRKGII